MSVLSPDKALIFRITHIANMPWILANGLHCPNSDIRDPRSALRAVLFHPLLADALHAKPTWYIR